MLRFPLFIPARFYNTAGSAVEGGGSGSGPASTAPSSTQSSQSSAPAASTPAGSQSATSPTATSTTPGTTTPPTTTPADDLQDGNWRELRNRYETQKTEIANLKAQSTSTSQIITHAQGIATRLGYTEQDFNEAFTANPLKTLEILQAEAAANPEGQSTQTSESDLSKQIEDAVNKKLSPFQEAQNRQATEVAMTKYEGILTDTFKADPILKDAPQEVLEIVKDYIGEYFSSQPQVLLAMKQKGDFSAVPDTVKFVAGRLHGAFKAWLAKSGAPAPAASAARTSGSRPTLDQIINDPSVLGPQYKA